MWHNSYAGDSANHIVELRVHQSNRDYRIDRSQLDAEHPTVRLRTDDRSYVLPSFQHSNPTETIAFLGGSTTECVAVKETSRFPARVSEILSKNSHKVNALNAARSGNTLHDSINVLLNHVAMERPDIAVIMHACNDVGVLSQDGNYESRGGKPLSLMKIATWAKNGVSKHLYTVAVARKFMSARMKPESLNKREERTSSAIAQELDIKQFQTRLRIMIHMCHDLGIVPVLMTQPFSSSTNELTPDWTDLGAQNLFNEIIRQTGKEESVKVIDLVKHVVENVPEWDKQMNVFYDGIHVTDRGSEIYANHIAQELSGYIK